MYKYVCAIRSFPNCRVHGGSDNENVKLRFLKSMEQIKEEVLQTYQDSEYGDIYQIETGDVYGRIEYNFTRHELREIKIHAPDGGVLVDNGYGKKVWKTFDEYRGF